ncbi:MULTISPECIES: hypothetical protein [unclassified Streptomyces]|uniref:hypothetical protein n=1 Tax=unclassified Streptomyces TaxID=2593676 RepID=UPI001EF8B282|nr:MULTISPECIES: hypothetical protein [unclassified Streptomyces]
MPKATAWWAGRGKLLSMHTPGAASVWRLPVVVGDRGGGDHAGVIGDPDGPQRCPRCHPDQPLTVITGADDPGDQAAVPVVVFEAEARYDGAAAEAVHPAGHVEVRDVGRDSAFEHGDLDVDGALAVARAGGGAVGADPVQVQRLALAVHGGGLAVEGRHGRARREAR